MNFQKHIISLDTPVRQTLSVLDRLALDAIIFVVDEQNKLLGSITDGDMRRGFIRGLDFEDPLIAFVQANPKFLVKDKFALSDIIQYREQNFKILPVVNDNNEVVDIINLRQLKSYLPVDAVIMAGGRGERLRPLTDAVPKPLLKVGAKPIIEHNIERLRLYGIFDIWISVKYLGDQIKNYFGDGSSRFLNIHYIEEDTALGTAGALSIAENLSHDTVLLMNSDLLTNINFEDFFLFFESQQADMAVACVPYQVNVPYAVMETESNFVTGLSEKPTLTYYANTGIYLLKRSIVEQLPKGAFLNATDLIENLLQQNRKIASYPLIGYWLDIGKHDDFQKAQEDIKHLSL